MRFRGRTTLLIVLALTGIASYLAAPYARAASLFVRAANVGGRIEGLANATARTVTVLPRHVVPTRQGDVAAQWYRPSGRIRRATLLIPGIHSMGITEPRLTALATDLAGSGVAVMALALPDLMGYQITARSADVIEDAVGWMAAQPEFAPDGRVGMIGISFAGGLSIVAAGRPSIRDKVAYVLSFGGHGDLERVLKYLATGEAVQAQGLVTHPPHDYGVAVITYAGAELLVPHEQVAPLREGILYFPAGVANDVGRHGQGQCDLPAGPRHRHDAARAGRDLAHVRQRPQRERPRPSARTAHCPRGRSGGVPERAPAPPAAPVFLLHGNDDIVIPAAESVVLAHHLRQQGVDVRLLLSQIITHAELDRAAAISDSWRLIAFWADVLGR